ncbi:hypothetical protein CYMTET_38465 [Cymbomonas tetramitiformis]|uniref:Uncharacterized protein n=1 Tax=Cymbomonas tetramitiformis TaxID=36881 RepID=A0AAE0CE75_9CHLO|nr:hypothetical protein CYMTET_38465 [Cymbomonas tetramitiformis]
MGGNPPTTSLGMTGARGLTSLAGRVRGLQPLAAEWDPVSYMLQRQALRRVDGPRGSGGADSLWLVYGALFNTHSLALVDDEEPCCALSSAVEEEPEYSALEVGLWCRTGETKITFTTALARYRVATGDLRDSVSDNDDPGSEGENNE